VWVRFINSWIELEATPKIQSSREQEAFPFMHPKRGVIRLRVIVGKIAATVVGRLRGSLRIRLCAFCIEDIPRPRVMHFCHTRRRSGRFNL